VDKQWTELSPEKKREARFQRWLSPENVKFRSPEAEQLYKGRVTRLIKAIKLQEPDRVPVHLPYGFFPAFYAGGTLQSVMYDYDELRRSWTKFIHDFDMDTYIGPSLVFPARALENLNYRVFKWPGYGLAPDASTYQFVEGENMKADEYDAFISNPADFMQRSFLPRIMGVLEPLQHLSPLNHMMGIPMGYIAPYGRPDVQSALKTLMEAGQEIMKWQEAVAECNREALESGLPTFFGGGGGVPFDAIGDFLRGTQGIMMDMFRQPEKLHEAMEKIMPTGIRMAISGANASGVPIVAFALHKGDDSFMSLKQFEAFYWSYLKRVLLALIDEGLQEWQETAGLTSEREGRKTTHGGKKFQRPPLRAFQACSIKVGTACCLRRIICWNGPRHQEPRQ